jgi:hypothetical protein
MITKTKTPLRIAVDRGLQYLAAARREPVEKLHARYRSDLQFRRMIGAKGKQAVKGRKVARAGRSRNFAGRQRLTERCGRLGCFEAKRLFSLVPAPWGARYGTSCSPGASAFLRDWDSGDGARYQWLAKFCPLFGTARAAYGVSSRKGTAEAIEERRWHDEDLTTRPK